MTNDYIDGRSDTGRWKNGRYGPHYGTGLKAEHTAWSNMLRRCYDKNQKGYKYYGGRGITVCKEWRENFLKFLSDVGEKPSPEYSLDRWPNNSGNYEPGNVRWATAREQARNKRRIIGPSGVRGVCGHEGEWEANICDDTGKQISLGKFPSIEEAAIARKEGEIKYWILHEKPPVNPRDEYTNKSIGQIKRTAKANGIILTDEEINIKLDKCRKKKIARLERKFSRELKLKLAKGI